MWWYVVNSQPETQITSAVNWFQYAHSVSRSHNGTTVSPDTNVITLCAFVCVCFCQLTICGEQWGYYECPSQPLPIPNIHIHIYTVYIYMGMGIYWHRGVLSLLPIFCSTSAWQDSSLPGSHQELLRTVLPGAWSSGRWQACFLKWSHTLETLVLICLASDRWPQPQENVLHSCLAVQRYRLEDLFPQPNRTQNSACRTALSAQYPSHHKFHHRQQRRLARRDHNNGKRHKFQI